MSHSQKGLVMNAAVAKTNPPAWVVLRVWAAELRDTRPEVTSKAKALIALLDTWEVLNDHASQLARSLWRTCLLLSRDIRKSIQRG